MTNSEAANPEPWIGVARCTAAAERASSICKAFGQPATRIAVAESLERLWQVAAGSLEQARLAGIELRLAATPDAHADDSHTPSFDAMSATAITAYAAQAVTNPAAVGDALEAAADLWSGIDFVLADSRGGARPDWIGDLETRERESQEEDRAALMPDRRQATVDDIRVRAVRAREGLKDVLRVYAQVRGWP
jgi:hypothetical protein